MLTVTSPASDTALLSPAELAEAIGVSPSSPLLAPLNAKVAALLSAACGLERAGAAALTLRLETLTETQRLPCGVDVLYLARKPIVEVLTLTEGETVLVEDTDFEQRDGRSLVRLCDSGPRAWVAGRIEISYRAGWETAPADLKLLASKLAVALHGERQRDPSLKRESIPGVIDREYWVGAKDDPLITAEIWEGLKAGGYLMHEMAY